MLKISNLIIIVFSFFCIQILHAESFVDEIIIKKSERKMYVLIENDEVILTNEYVLNQIGDGSFSDFLKLMNDISDSVVEKMKEHKKEEEKKKKEYEKKEFSAALSDLGDIAGEALSEHIKNRDAKGQIDRDLGGFLARGMGDSLGESAARKRAEGKFANKMDDLKAEEKQRREKDSVDIKDVIADAKKKHQDD